MYTFRQISNISRTNSQNVHLPYLVLQLFCPIHWSQVLSQEWRCSWSSAASDVPTTSDWSTIILPPKVRLILKVLRYKMCEYVWLCRSQCFCFYFQQFEPVKRDPKTYGQFYSGDAYIVLKVRFCYGQDIWHVAQLRISHLKKKSKLFLFAPRILELTSYFGEFSTIQEIIIENWVSSWWQLCRHWRKMKLSLWSSAVSTVTTKLALCHFKMYMNYHRVYTD